MLSLLQNCVWKQALLSVKPQALLQRLETIQVGSGLHLYVTVLSFILSPDVFHLLPSVPSLCRDRVNNLLTALNGMMSYVYNVDVWQCIAAIVMYT